MSNRRGVAALGLQGDIGVDIASRIGDVEQGAMDHVGPGAPRHQVAFEPSPAPPFRGAPRAQRHRLLRLAGAVDDALVKATQAVFAEEWRHRGDQSVRLAVTVAEQGLAYRIGQSVGRRAGGCHEGGNVAAGLLKNGQQIAGCVAGTLKEAVGQVEKRPHQVQPFGGFGVSERCRDQALQGRQLRDQGFDGAPADIVPGRAQGGQAFANIVGELAWTFRRRQFEPEPAFGGGVTRRHFHQQVRQTLGAEGGQVFGVQNGFRRHGPNVVVRGQMRNALLRGPF